MKSVHYTVRHHYRYVYTSPIFDVKQRLIMIPPDLHADQVLVSFDFDVRGAQGRVAIDWQTDVFGNRVCRVEAERADHALDFEARFETRREGVQAPHAEQFEAGLGFTALTASDARIKAAARDIEARAATAQQRAELAHDWAAASIAFEVGVTGTQTPASMALHLGRGVCQDYAHIMLSVLRTLGIPAHYVSGHLLGEGPPHAWVEVLIDNTTIVAYDPTHHRRAGLNYVTVATGRDFADVTSTSGVFSGSAIGKLHWSKHAATVEAAAEAAA